MSSWPVAVLKRDECRKGVEALQWDKINKSIGLIISYVWRSVQMLKDQPVFQSVVISIITWIFLLLPLVRSSWNFYYLEIRWHSNFIVTLIWFWNRIVCWVPNSSTTQSRIIECMLIILVSTRCYMVILLLFGVYCFVMVFCLIVSAIVLVLVKPNINQSRAEMFQERFSYFDLSSVEMLIFANIYSLRNEDDLVYLTKNS